MANKAIMGLSIQIDADTLGLDKALKDVEAKSRTASSELKAINSAIKTAGDSAVLWQQKQHLLNDALEKSREKVKILEDAQKGFTERFNNKEIDQGTYDKFREKLTRAKDVLSAFKSQQEQVEAKFKNGEIDQGKYDKFCKSVETAENRVKALETAEHSMEENLRLGNISEEQYRVFQREVEYARAAVEKYENGLKEANEKVEKLGSESSDTADDVKELGDKADSTASGGISAMTVALGNLVADGIKKAGSELKDFTADVIQTGASFEAAMSNVGAISGASAGDLEKLTAKAEEMGATTKFTAAESADAFQYMAMAGWKTEDMLSGIDGILSLAAASGEDLGTTSDIVTDALTAFGLTADDAGHFADVLAAASSNANTNVSMMGETFKYVAPIAGALNFSVEDTAEAIGLMANSGIKASQAGTSLRAILTAMTDTSEKAYSAFQELGVETINTDGSMRGLGEILDDLRVSWQNLTEAEQADYAQRIAGKEAMSGFLSLVNAAPEDIGKLSGAIRDCDGAASDMSTTMIDNLHGDMTILGSAVDGMKISLSKKLNPALRDITQYITRNIPNIEKKLENFFSKGISAVDFFIKHLPQITKAVSTMMPVVKGAISAFLAYKLYDKASKFKTMISDIGKALSGISSPKGAFTLAVGAAGLLADTLDKVGDAMVARQEKHEQTLASLINDEYREAAGRINDCQTSLKDMKDSFNENAGTIEAETQRTQDLWEELQSLTDASGKVKDADKIRADYILGELNEALGTEYTMTGNQIENYKTMQAEIDKLIEKKRAMAYIETYSEDSAKYGKIQQQSLDEYATAKSEYDENYRELDYLRIKASQLSGRYLKNSLELGKFLDNLEYDGDELSDSGVDVDALKAMRGKYDELSANHDQLRKNKGTAKESYREATDYLNKLSDAQKAMSEERYDDVQKILWTEQNTFKKIYESEQAAFKERETAWKKFLDSKQSALELALQNGDRSNAVYAAKEIKDALENGKAAGFNGGSGFSVEFRRQVEEMNNAGFDTSGLDEWGGRSGDSAGGSFARAFAARIVGSNTLNNARDITENALSGAVSIISDLPKFASGGFLGSGQGIVAEAGPELIEIMNGGAKITPLTGTARNTPVTSGNSGRVVYINNTINAQISGKYDVRHLAEDLAGEQRRIERNLGL